MPKLRYGRVKGISVHVPTEHDAGVNDAIEHIFGDAPHFRERGGIFHPNNQAEFLEHLGGAVGATKGSSLTLYTDGRHPAYGGRLIVRARSPEGLVTKRSFTRRPGEKAEVFHDWQDGKAMRGGGYRRTVKAVGSLRKLGVGMIRAEAAGNKLTAQDKKDPISGYIAWPRMGFEGTIKDEHFAKMPSDIRSQMGSDRSLSKLHSIPGGREAWAEHGGTTHVHLNLDNPTHVRRLTDYWRGRTRLRDANNEQIARDNKATGMKTPPQKYSRLLSKALWFEKPTRVRYSRGDHVGTQEHFNWLDEVDRQPTDKVDLPRQIYADWLEEHGDPLSRVVRGHALHKHAGERPVRDLQYWTGHDRPMSISIGNNRTLTLSRGWVDEGTHVDDGRPVVMDLFEFSPEHAASHRSAFSPSDAHEIISNLPDEDSPPTDARGTAKSRGLSWLEQHFGPEPEQMSRRSENPIKLALRRYARERNRVMSAIASAYAKA